MPDKKWSHGGVVSTFGTSLLMCFVLWTFLGSNLSAHDCGPSEIRLKVGERIPYRVVADVSESEPSRYEMSINSDPSVALASPDNFFSTGFGEFVIEGVQPGTNQFVFEWSYAPNDASGFCVVNVIVEPPTTASAPREDTSGNQTHSAEEGDPINMLTGELVLNVAPDLILPGPMPVVFRRYYASSLWEDQHVQSTLGQNWSHNFDTRLLIGSAGVDLVTFKGLRASFVNEDGSWELEGQGTVPFQLAEQETVFVLLDPRDDGVYHFAKDSGRLIQIEDRYLNRLTLTYDGPLLVSVSDGRGRTLQFTYSGFQRLESVTDGQRTVTFSYGGSRMIQVTGPGGNTTRYEYDAGQANQAWLTREVRPLGNVPWTQTYDATGRVVTQTDALGNEVRYQYSEVAGGFQTDVIRLPEEDPPLTRSYLHDAQGRLVRVTDENGNAVRYGYDTGSGRRIWVEDRLGERTSLAYHGGSGKVNGLITPEERQYHWEFSPREHLGLTFYELTKTVRPDGAEEIFERDETGRVIRRTDPAGNTWEYQRNEHGQPTAETNPLGGTVAMTYHPDGLLASRTDPAGNTTEFEYDAVKRLTIVIHPDGTRRTVAFDPRGLLVRKTLENGGTYTYEFDGNGNRIQETDPLELTRTWEYDAMDRLVRASSYSGASMAYDYDERGLVVGFTDHLGNEIGYRRDPAGFITGIIDQAGQTWMLTNNAEGLVIASRDPLGKIRRHERDWIGRPLARISREGNRTEYTYDASGRLVRTLLPGGTAEVVEYDARGLTRRRELEDTNVSAMYQRGPLGKLRRMTDPNGNFWSSEYDVQGRLIATVDPLNRRTEYEYDSRNRKRLIRFPENAGWQEIVYDGVNAVTQRSYSDGTTLDYEYDERGHFIASDGITLDRNAAGRIVESNGIAMSRNAEGLIESMTFAPEKVVRYTYNSRNQVTEISDWTGAFIRYTYDLAGLPATMERSNGITTQFTWNGERRLIAITEETLHTVTASRDGAGRVTRFELAPSLEMSLASTDRFMDYDAAHQTVGLSYDAKGRLAGQGAQSFVWDAANRLLERSGEGTMIRYTYDAFGNRLSRNAGGQAESYVWNYGSALPALAIVRRDGQDQRYYIHTPGGDLLYAVDAATEAPLFYHFDPSGNTLAVTGSGGEVRAKYLYGPYGTVLVSEGNLENPYVWQGRYGVWKEPDSSLYYMRARYYDAEQGRFLTPDPLPSTLPRAINPYQYALGDPLRFNDPLGLSAEPVSSQPTTTGPTSQPGSSPENPIYLTDSEFDAEVTRVKNVLKERVKEAEWGWFDPQIPATFDSGYLARQREYFYFRGEVMNGGELNYYFQGMYWAELGVPKTVMNGIIHAYKQYKYDSSPSANDLFAACQGFEDNGNFVTEVRDEFLDRVNDVTSLPRRTSVTVREYGYRFYDFVDETASSASSTFSDLIEGISGN